MKVDVRTVLTMLQWFAVGTLSVNAVINAAQDRGILMAINCICLGFVLCALLSDKVMTRMWRETGEAREAFRAAERAMLGAAEAMQRAINSGRIEVVPIQPDTDGDHDGPTRH